MGMFLPTAIIDNAAAAKISHCVSRYAVKLLYALYKSFTYLLTYLLTCKRSTEIASNRVDDVV